MSAPEFHRPHTLTPGGVYVPRQDGIELPPKVRLVRPHPGAMTYMGSTVAMWQARAGQAYDSGVWGSGMLYSTLYSSEVAAYNTEVTAYNSLLGGLNNPDGVTTVACNWATLPDNGTSGTTFTLTLPRTGHFVIGAVMDATLHLNSFGDGFTATLSGLISSSKSSSSGWNNSGDMSFHAGWYAHGDYSQGQTLTLSVATQFVVGSSSSASGTLFAHFVPNASYHN